MMRDLQMKERNGHTDGWLRRERWCEEPSKKRVYAAQLFFFFGGSGKLLKFAEQKQTFIIQPIVDRCICV
jgi:hypothetical protein